MLDKRVETDSTMWILSSIGKINTMGSNLSTPELVQEANKTTYPTKLDILEKDTHTMSLLRTLEVDSISSERDFSSFWTESCREMSKRLLSLTEIGSVGLGSIGLNTLQNKTIAESWFSTKHNSHLKKNLFKTLFPLSVYSPIEFTVSGNTQIKSRKIRIYPNKEDIKTYNRYLGLSRYWFNQAVNYLKQAGTKASIMEVRKIQKNNHPEWAYNCPQRIREHAMLDACNAVKNAKLKCKRTGEFQNIGYRTRKDSKQGIGFDKQSLKQNNLFGGKHSIKFHSTEVINVEKEGNRIVKENGRWFVITPIEYKIKKPETQRLGVVALDCGVRTFQTYYSPFTSGKIGDGDFSRIFRICYRIDNIISKMSKADYMGRKRLKKARNRLYWKIKDLISDIHHKSASFLVKNFDTILIPTFETSNMVQKLRSKTARAMLTWGHYRFKEFLKFKGREYSCNVIEVNESYTSKTCSSCGKVQNIGSKKTFRCKCGLEMDRDLNGAKNIYLRNISFALAASPFLNESSDCISNQLVESC
jgi:putative transposase